MESLPDWFEKIMVERQAVAMDRLVTTHSGEELWEAKGRIAAFLDIKNEIDIVKSQMEQADKEAAERYLAHNG
jgi:hypothetical protein